MDFDAIDREINATASKEATYLQDVLHCPPETVEDVIKSRDGLKTGVGTPSEFIASWMAVPLLVVLYLVGPFVGATGKVIKQLVSAVCGFPTIKDGMVALLKVTGLSQTELTAEQREELIRALLQQWGDKRVRERLYGMQRVANMKKARVSDDLIRLTSQVNSLKGELGRSLAEYDSYLLELDNERARIIAEREKIRENFNGQIKGYQEIVNTLAGVPSQATREKALNHYYETEDLRRTYTPQGYVTLVGYTTGRKEAQRMLEARVALEPGSFRGYIDQANRIGRNFVRSGERGPLVSTLPKAVLSPEKGEGGEGEVFDELDSFLRESEGAF
jgi:hypothetical protein